jgi:hypothetical protein
MCSGGAASCEKDDLLVVDNMISGFSLHKLSDGAYIRGYPTQVSGRAFIKAVNFLENSRVVVGGSDHGIVYLFDRDTGETIDTLRHADGGLVQILAVRIEYLKVDRKLTQTPDSSTRWK